MRPSSGGGILPRGHYMAFLVTKQGAICEKAAWVWVQ